jgi:hypothetical protein
MASEAVRTVLSHVWSVIEPSGNRCALIGGAALAVWNYPRATRDIDLLVGIDQSSLESLIDQLLRSGCRPKNSPYVVSIDKLRFIQFLYTPVGEFYDIQFDLWVADSELQQSALARRVRRTLPGINLPIDVIQADDLILFKLAAGRIIDRADAAMLLRENRGSLDFDYVRCWVAKLDLDAEFGQIWEEAFPGEPLPHEG